MLKIIANGKEYILPNIHQEANERKGSAKIQGKSKVRTLASVDTEQYAQMLDFAQAAASSNRLEQMLQYMQTELLKPFELSSMGTFLSLVFADISKEEADTIVENQFESRKLNGLIANIARPWYIQKYNEG